jgi:N-6 DNA Methylase
MTAASQLRKSTGSYYTPAALVDCLLDSTLQPLIDGALQADDPERALLEITVCDPACGGGVFLVRAARRIAWHLAMYRAGITGSIAGELPAARYEVATRLIHGVDISPLAVDTCRLMTAATAYIPGVPNPRLDHHIKCGNALLGATPALLAQGIPDAAFQPLPGDDPAVAAELRRRNRAERNAQPGEPQEAAPRTPARRRGSPPPAP